MAPYPHETSSRARSAPPAARAGAAGRCWARPRYASMTFASRWISAGVPSAIFSPWSRTETRSQRPITTFMLCSMRRMVFPSARSFPMRRLISADSLGFMPASGSSRRSRRAPVASARATSSRRCCPYGRFRARSFRRSDSPTKSRASSAASVICCSSARAHAGRRSAPNSSARDRQWYPTRRLSRADISPKSWMFWKVRATPSPGMRCAGRPTRSCPATATRPATGRYTPVITFSIVVLPEPLGPMSARISPSSTARSTPDSARSPPNSIVTPATSRRLIALAYPAACPAAGARRRRRRPMAP